MGVGSPAILIRFLTDFHFFYFFFIFLNALYTFELRDEGEYGFLLPREQILPTAKEYTAGVKSLMEYTLDNFEGKSAGSKNGIVGLLVVILCLIS